MGIIVLEKLVFTRFFCVDTKKSSYHHPRMNIHRRIKERRIACGYSSHKALAAVLKVSWQTVQFWETEGPGGTAPKRTRLEQVAEVLRTSPEWLLYGIDPAQQPKALEFAELSGLEAQLVMLYRQLDDDAKHDLSVYANKLANKTKPDERSAANPFPERRINLVHSADLEVERRSPSEGQSTNDPLDKHRPRHPDEADQDGESNGGKGKR